MKTKMTLWLLCGVTLFALMAAIFLRRPAAPSNVIPPGAQVFEVRGVVRSVDAAAKTVRITHEEIPDYMPAMTMPFAVINAALLRGLTSNDLVRFRFVVTDDDSWIDRIEKVTAEQSNFKAAAPLASPDRELDRVQTGERVPDFTLTNQWGRAIHLADYQGRALVLTFIYTRCPLPNFCPRLTQNFTDLQKRLREEFDDQAQLLSITMDPEFDSPEVLRNYGLRHEADFQTWTFATGSREQTDYAGALFGLIHENVGGLINHDLRTALIGPDGRLVHLWRSNVWTPYEVQREVRAVLTGNRDIVPAR